MSAPAPGLSVEISITDLDIFASTLSVSEFLKYVNREQIEFMKPLYQMLAAMLHERAVKTIAAPASVSAPAAPASRGGRGGRGGRGRGGVSVSEHAAGAPVESAADAADAAGAPVESAPAAPAGRGRGRGRGGRGGRGGRVDHFGRAGASKISAVRESQEQYAKRVKNHTTKILAIARTRSPFRSLKLYIAHVLMWSTSADDHRFNTTSICVAIHAVRQLDGGKLFPNLRRMNMFYPMLTPEERASATQKHVHDDAVHEGVGDGAVHESVGDGAVQERVDHPEVLESNSGTTLLSESYHFQDAKLTREEHTSCVQMVGVLVQTGGEAIDQVTDAVQKGIPINTFLRLTNSAHQEEYANAAEHDEILSYLPDVSSSDDE
jgi:hypothetical protein